MDSIFSQLFLLLQQRIKTTVPEIRYIDQDLGQLETYDQQTGRPAVAWPCVLIDFEITNSLDHHQGVQWLEIAASFRLAFSPFSSANSLAPDEVKQKALQYYELENKLYVALQNFDAGGCVQPFTRVSAQTEKREDTIRVRNMTFTTSTEDDAAKYMHQILKRPIDLTLEIDNAERPL